MVYGNGARVTYCSGNRKGVNCTGLSYSQFLGVL